MLIKLTGGRIYDPANGIDGEVRDIFIENGRIVDPSPNAKVAHEYPVHGRVIMAGGIDPHSHIGGGKMTIARMMLPEDHIGQEVERTDITRAGVGHAIPSTMTAGYRYAEMGYTAAFEPAMLPANARQAHMELADTAIIDKGAFAMLGSDDFFLRQLAGKQDFSAIKDYIAWTMHATQAIAVKVVNPGGISAFKFNQRKLDLDEKHVYYGVTPRDIILALARGLKELGVVHPIHIHGCNLGIPGGVETTLATIKGAEGLPIHLTHIQFHSYGTEGDMKFSSAAAEVAEAVNTNPNVSCDVGQVMFGQTCTASGDSMRQFVNTRSAYPKKWVVMDIECDAGCGVVPFKYRDKSFVNALQWAIGLELFLLINDPWRLFLTTDHPNGGPFTCYPHLIRLLMDKAFRQDVMQTINQDALKYSTLASLDREYTLYEIAIMTRAGPARSLGLADRGHLGVGACADITVYDDNPDREAMFATPEMLFKNGELIVRNGKIIKAVNGATHVARPSYDRGIERQLKRYFDDYNTVRMENFRVSDEEILDHGRGSLIIQPTKARLA
ncbi:formylmethanofuran dehydrogenase subunit A [Hyphomicrobium denitrificans ATCC 51888]|uniref:Formylmethanofuran dehydrogenase subunit A n=1 Tax=Hyphomicrobium denitrificans (strain ATCC 51888 / DSM 1869 / NCIMB 11706 / TK 0415) TaxID=582899 RepID=D8JYG5_HYPDA|nr:formylmethanofuran dehydrogenase subunit A [Hyphomicrobium denitrificans]ADJ23417.1 formylmethanofuran dehydrogenase subunit A [Hyphomicrobium denitrificans ATCC 51888]